MMRFQSLYSGRYYCSGGSGDCVAVLTIQVVLVVYASDCFTLAASTVGISSVLSMAKKVVLGLSDARDYQLMVSNWSLVAAFDSGGARHCGKFYCFM